MKFVILTNLAFSLLLAQSAFAQNLGVLSDDQKPHDLVSANELTTGLNGNSDSNLNSDVRGRGYGYGHGYGYGYGHGYGYRYPYYNYPYYPYYYPYRYYSQDNAGGTTTSALDQSRIQGNEVQPTAEVSQTPVVCFASDSAGTWFAEADVSSNAASVQDKANQECLTSGAQCSVNLGCAIATNDQ